MPEANIQNAIESPPWIKSDEQIFQTTRQVGKPIEANTERPIQARKVMAITNEVWMDEGCQIYREMDLLQPDGTLPKHRYRFLYVVRNDILTEFIEDMGPASSIPGRPINLTGGEGHDIVETVASMIDIADGFRSKLFPDQRFEMQPFKKKTDIDITRKKI